LKNQKKSRPVLEDNIIQVSNMFLFIQDLKEVIKTISSKWS